MQRSRLGLIAQIRVGGTLGLTAFERTTVLGATTPLTAIAAAGVLPIRGVLKQHERPGIVV